MFFKKKKTIDSGCFSSKRVTVDKQKVRYMYREKPDEGIAFADSGWRFFAGDESDEYVNTPENIGIYHISTIVEIDSAVLPYLQSPYGKAYIRKGDKFEEK